MVNLTSKEANTVFQIMSEFSFGHGSRELRERTGPLLLDLFDAQYFASYVWSEPDSIFGDRVSLSMSDENLCAYEAYYQFCDPITPTLQRRRRATAVAEVISRPRLENTEFFNDFLARDGLHYGINYYAYSGSLNIGDLRIWRARHREEFSRRDIRLLDAIGPAFTNSMRLALARDGHDQGTLTLIAAAECVQVHTRLTKREKEVALAMLLGRSDKQIAEQCGIAHTTVRTHLKHIFEKLEISGRNQLFRRLALH